MTPPSHSMAKRALDLLIASILVLLALPVIVFAAIGSAIALRAWPFFVQERVGHQGRTFRFVKIRTLPPATPPDLAKQDLQLDRVPRFSRALRRLHLDELPQLFLVLSGRMSLVGPRPEMARLHAGLDPVFAIERTSVRPGCTGLWQVGAGCTGLIGEAPEYDRFYLRHQSVGLDVWILWRTARVMLGRGPVLHLDEVPDWAIEVDARSVAVAPPARELELAEIGD